MRRISIIFTVIFLIFFNNVTLSCYDYESLHDEILLNMGLKKRTLKRMHQSIGQKVIYPCKKKKYIHFMPIKRINAKVVDENNFPEEDFEIDPFNTPIDLTKLNVLDKNDLDLIVQYDILQSYSKEKK